MAENNIHYTKAPIIEAIIDIRTRFEDPRQLSKQHFDVVAEAFSQDFPYQEELKSLSFKMNFVPGEAPKPEQDSLNGFFGYKLVNENRSRAIQIRRDGFTYSHLPPYTDWKTFRDEARSIWAHYVNCLKPATVTRRAIRYINKLELPASEAKGIEVGGTLDPAIFFNTFIQCIPEMPGNEVTNYSFQVQYPQKDLNAVLQVSQALARPNLKNHVAFVLDIDLFNSEEVDSGAGKDFWRYFDQLRTRKNEVFEVCITDKTRELIR